MQAALGDQIAEGTVREQLEVDDGCQRAQDEERDQECNQRSDRDTSTEVKARVVMTEMDAQLSTSSDRLRSCRSA